MLRFIKKMFITLLRLGGALATKSYLQNCISLGYQPCQVKPTLIDLNYNETLHYPFVVSINKCGGRCNTIDDPYASVCISNKVKV